MDLKATLSMPNSEFPMRAGLAQKEPLLVEKWQSIDLYGKMNADRIDAPVFVLHDGPPYANGDIHCGHALNRCLKDFIVRYKNMGGFRTPFVFGWDTHGLPIENKVTKSGVDRKKTPIAEFRKICADYAFTQVDRQKAQILRLGCIGDYKNPYITLLPEFEARQIEVFSKMAMKGLIFKGFKPVYWSWSSESALAEAEVEYQDVTSKTLYVPVKVKKGNDKVPDDASFVIWTTTPWTLPSNQGVTLNPKFEYGVYQTNKGKLIFLTSLEESLKEEWKLTSCELLSTFKGQEAEGVICHQPIYPDKDSLVMVASFVTDEAGTGCVHTDSDHGNDDFNVCHKYGIKPQCLVDEHGVYHTFEGDPIDGVFYEKVNDMIVDRLTAEGRVLSRNDIVHSYPHDWRTKKPVIYRATAQWFCSIDPIREDLLRAIKEVKWIPAWGEAKMTNMIKDRSDWCISRQRVWGVPIPIIYNEDGSPILEQKVFDRIRDLFAKHGSNCWFTMSAKEILPEGYTNPASPNGEFVKEKDIMDVWFDSGSSWNTALIDRGEKYPADLYLEGNDQYRGWFNASLILSLATTGVPAFKAVATHGWVMDESWQKMSKSSGNGIDPNKLIGQFGADILRLWAGSVDYHADARLSESIVATASDNYRKIRNTFKFMLGNIEGYKEEKVSYSFVDRFILARLEETKNKVLACYDNYDFRGVIDAILVFASADLSSFYLDNSKDILYCDAPSSNRRKAVVSVIHKCARELCLLLNPILPFTMEEVYSYLPGEKKESVQLELMPEESHEFDEKVLKDYASFMALRDVVNKSLESARAEGKIGSSAEAEAKISVKDGELYDLLVSSGEEAVRKAFILSAVELEKGEEDGCVSKPHDATQCPRCRLYVDEVEQVEDVCLCHRCAEAVKEKGE